MKNYKTTLVILLLLIGSVESNAQFFETLKRSPWIFGAGWNIVDDNGNPGRIFNFSDWNMKSYPSAIRVEKYYQDGFSFVFKGSYNQYNGGKIINSEAGVSSTFLAFDLESRYNFCELYDINSEWFNFTSEVFDAYGAFGLGYTMRSTEKVGGASTFNFGIGLHTWVYGNWGLNMEAMGKLGINGNFWSTPANYTQYSFGVIYKLGNRKRLTGKGDKFSNRKSRTKI